MAKLTFTDSVHLNNCIAEVRWLHSHNLKYPDTRVAGQRLIADDQLSYEGGINSTVLPELLGWSHNSNAVNKAKLFCTTFVWQQQRLSLVAVVLEPSKEWLKAFRAIGINKAQVAAIRELLLIEDNQSHCPEEVSDYSPQLRFLYNDDYIAITPVVSHAVMSELQQYRRLKQGRFTIVSHPYPSSVGDLSSSLGGYISVLNYPPPVWSSNKHNLHSARQKSLEQGGDVLDNNAIYSQSFSTALNSLIYINTQQTRKQQRQIRAISLRLIRKKLLDWFTPILEWRESYAENPQSTVDLQVGSLEAQMLTMNFDKYPELVISLNQKLHQLLQNKEKTSKFAYHPQLLLPIKRQLFWLLKSFSKAVVPIESTHTQYLHLEAMRVFDAKSLACPYLNGIPSLTALWGFAYNFKLRINKLMGSGIKLKSVAWFIRDYHSLVGKKLPEYSVVKKRDNSIKRPGIIDDKYCDLVMDVVLEFDVDEEDRVQLGSNLQFLQAALPSNFAGGAMQPPSLFENKNWCQLYYDQNLLFAKLARLPRNGCWITPSSIKVNNFTDLIEYCSVDSSKKPAMLGFLLLEEPTERRGSIAEEHAFVEPVLGIVECNSPVGVRFIGAQRFFSHAFWRLKGEKGCLLMEKA